MLDQGLLLGTQDITDKNYNWQYSSEPNKCQCTSQITNMRKYKNRVPLYANQKLMCKGKKTCQNNKSHNMLKNQTCTHTHTHTHTHKLAQTKGSDVWILSTCITGNFQVNAITGEQRWRLHLPTSKTTIPHFKCQYHLCSQIQMHAHFLSFIQHCFDLCNCS